MNDHQLITVAEESLTQSRKDKVVARAKSFALDSIAASLIVIARNSLPVTVEATSQPLSADDVELIYRRMHDEVKDGRKSKAS